MKFSITMGLIFWFFLNTKVYARIPVFHNEPRISIQNIENILDWFVASPHPMGTPEQKSLTQDLLTILKGFNIPVQVQEFYPYVPDVYNQKQNLVKVSGYNVIAQIPGSRECTIVLGAHTDTKFFKSFKFVGANDGGSGTALLIELARVLSHSKNSNTHKNMSSLSSCALTFVFFDGEEALLENWDEGSFKYGKPDHLYGSKSFVKNFVKDKNLILNNKNLPIELVIIVDMIGHKNQNLFITKYSDQNYALKLLNLKKGVNISLGSFAIQDDHLPFQESGLKFLHIIDWVNIDEWHTQNDNLSIVSPQKILEFGNTLQKFIMD